MRLPMSCASRATRWAVRRAIRKKEILSGEIETLRQAARILHNFMGHATTVPT